MPVSPWCPASPLLRPQRGSRCEAGPQGIVGWREGRWAHALSAHPQQKCWVWAPRVQRREGVDAHISSIHTPDCVLGLRGLHHCPTGRDTCSSQAAVYWKEGGKTVQSGGEKTWGQLVRWRRHVRVIFKRLGLLSTVPGENSRVDLCPSHRGSHSMWQRLFHQSSSEKERAASPRKASAGDWGPTSWRSWGGILETHWVTGQEMHRDSFPPQKSKRTQPESESISERKRISSLFLKVSFVGVSWMY